MDWNASKSELTPGVIDSTATLNARHRDAYDRVAPIYATTNREMPAGLVKAAEEFCALVGSSARVLDLGCGHGRDIVWFGARGIVAIGADLSFGMLTEASRRVSSPLVQLDMRFPAFGSSIFGGIWCDASILHLPKRDVPMLLREIRRLLVPRGVLFVTLKEGEGEAWEPRSYGVPAPRFFARYQPREFGELLVASGFPDDRSSREIAGPQRWVHFLVRRDAAR